MNLRLYKSAEFLRKFKIMNKSYKQTEFLRKFLAAHNIEWELKLIEVDNNLILYHFKVLLLNKFAVSNEHDIVFLEAEDIAAMSDNELDTKYNLSSYALRLFMNRWDEAYLKKFSYLSSAEYNAINNTIKKFKTYFSGAIDYVALVQNCILDGIDLKDFPDIEDVI